MHCSMSQFPGCKYFYRGEFQGYQCDATEFRVMKRYEQSALEIHYKLTLLYVLKIVFI